MLSRNELDRLQEKYGDQYVKVDGPRADLARFRGRVGQVKTVNWNGRALVQFDPPARGWHDIDLEFLTVVSPPTKE